MQTHLKGYFHTVKLASKYKRNKYERNSILWKTLMTLLQLRALTLIQSSDWYCLVPKSCPALCKPMDCSPPGSCVHGISQARLLEWVAISCFRGSSWPRDGTCISYLSGEFFTTESPGKPCCQIPSLYSNLLYTSPPNILYNIFKTELSGTSLVVQQLRFCTFNAGDMGSIPGWGTKIPHTAWCGQVNK